MNKKIVLRILAYLGTGLVWIPIAAPFFFTFLRLMQGGSLLFDFLMLAEFFPLVMIGGFLLLIAAWLSKTRQPHITWGLGIAVFSLAASQLSAEATGMASGETEPTIWMWALAPRVAGARLHMCGSCRNWGFSAHPKIGLISEAFHFITHKKH